ncbi:MAG TPA: amidophosphoribosyltransferase [Streptosporangiaceae bacterium]|nr:amidophosphoribosyltransferase [Streptosporangiaceae bacterium]
MSGDEMREECGVFGVFAEDEDVAGLTYFGLHALQHRGQDSAGIGVSDGQVITHYKNMGLVSEVFDQDLLAGLRGHIAIGHTRYSTYGSTTLSNAQPLRFDHPQIGPFLLAHNGNLTNAAALRDRLRSQGVMFASSSDTEIVGHLLTRVPGKTLESLLATALAEVEGAYCLLLMTKDALVAARDPLGIRPLCLGALADLKTGQGRGQVLASETCALDVVGAEFLREIEPAEIVSISAAGLGGATIPSQAASRAMCSFEFIYFARPDSVLLGQSLYETRRAMGRQLAAESPVRADIVITLPDSGTPAAAGFAEASGIPFVEGLIRSRYVTRSFIQPTQGLRESAIRLKFSPLRHLLAGKRVVLVDDSIVRGTTTRHIVDELRRAGAIEVHLRIASPPIRFPCFMGIDMTRPGELIAAGRSEAGVGQIVGADSLRYLTLSGLRRAVGRPDGNGFCFACFTGEYPITVPDDIDDVRFASE